MSRQNPTVVAKSGWNWKRWILVGVGSFVVLLFIVGIFAGDSDEEITSTTFPTSSDTRTSINCQTPANEVVEAIASTLTSTGPSFLRGAQAVLSKDFKSVYFLAADIQAAGLESDGDITVWATGRIDTLTWVAAANSFAREFTDLGSAGLSDRFNPNDNELAEAKLCDQQLDL